MSDYLMQYGLFLAEVVTIAGAIGAIAFIAIVAGQRERGGERIEVRDLGKRFGAMTRAVARETMPKKSFKRQEKARRQREKAEAKRAPPETRRRGYVLTFKGDIRARAVASLREEVSAILGVATAGDEVVVRLENAGGLVHEHGLAASQLLRIRERGIPLTAAVDKVAASGGYMMACVADRIVAAPFAVLGSIGVLAQIPNFNRLLDSHGVDFEQFKGGEHKRTVTMFGRNTDEDRAKLAEEIEGIHGLFKRFVAEHRPAVDIAQVATGEHWLASRAIEMSLCDELTTSDDYLMAAAGNADVLEINYRKKKALGDRVGAFAQTVIERAVSEIRERSAGPGVGIT